MLLISKDLLEHVIQQMDIVSEEHEKKAPSKQSEKVVESKHQEDDSSESEGEVEEPVNQDIPEDQMIVAPLLDFVTDGAEHEAICTQP